MVHVPGGATRSLIDMVRENAEKEMEDFIVAAKRPPDAKFTRRLLSGNPAQGLKVRACYHVTPEEITGTHFQGSSGAIGRALRERRPVFLTNAADQAWL